jgi:hypothetical protein
MNVNRMILIGGVLAVLAFSMFTLRDSISETVFSITGETQAGPQITALAQLPLNLTTPPLALEPDAAIRHTGLNPFGINTFLHQEVEGKKRIQIMELISAAGFKWIREEFSWQDIEISGRGDFVDRRNDPVRNAWNKYDQIVALAEYYDIQIVARLSSPPNWSHAAGNAQGDFAPPDHFEDYARFAAIVAGRYKGRIHYYQLWNEPNIYPEWGEQAVDPEAYTDLLCRAYHAIKAVDPEAVIISGALAPTAELSGRDLNDYIFLQRMYDAGAGECFDILAMQGYGLWSGPTDHRMRPLVVNYGRNQFIRDIMVKNGDAGKPIWISEMNWNTAPDNVEPRYGRVTLAQQAEWVPLAYQRAQADWPWVGVIFFWYFKRADPSWLAEQRPEAYFQMSDPDFNLMPVYETMKAYTHQPPVMHQGNHAADHWAVAYGDGWRVDGGIARAQADAQPVRFTFEGTSINILFDDADHPESAITFRVDGGKWLVVSPHVRSAVWKDWGGAHTIDIQPTGPVAIQGYIVENSLIPAPMGMILIAGLVIAGTGVALTRKL